MIVSTESDIRNSLKTLTIPLIERSVDEVGKVAAIKLNNDGVSIAIELGFPAVSLIADIREAVWRAG